MLRNRPWIPKARKQRLSTPSAKSGSGENPSAICSACCRASNASFPIPIRPRPRSGSRRSTAWCARTGHERADFLLRKVLKRARQLQVGLPGLVQSRYINTHLARAGAAVPRRRGDGAAHPPHHPLERGGHGAAREPPVRRHRRPPVDLRLGRESLRSRLQPLLPRQGRRPARATRSSSRATPRPASTRARSSKAGSANRSSITSAARSCPARGSRPIRTRGSCRTSGSSPRSRWASDRINAIYQARFNRYLHGARHRRTPRTRACGRSSATARWTSPKRSAR